MTRGSSGSTADQPASAVFTVGQARRRIEPRLSPISGDQQLATLAASDFGSIPSTDVGAGRVRASGLAEDRIEPGGKVALAQTLEVVDDTRMQHEIAHAPPPMIAAWAAAKLLEVLTRDLAMVFSAAPQPSVMPQPSVIRPATAVQRGALAGSPALSSGSSDDSRLPRINS